MRDRQRENKKEILELAWRRDLHIKILTQKKNLNIHKTFKGEEGKEVCQTEQ